ncbi:MAG: hypothetical protein ACRDGM_16210, partial [bacterium]
MERSAVKEMSAPDGYFRRFRSDLRDFNPRGVFIPGALREFFHDGLTLERAREKIHQALETREDRFLQLIRAQVY